MRMTLLFVVMMAFVGGCRFFGKTDQYGNHSGDISIKLVDDAFSQMVAVYPPAKTRLSIVQKVEDPFGMELVERLRQRGYGVEERLRRRGNRDAADLGVKFAYVVDEFKKEREIRLTLYVGAESLSRLYGISGEKLEPIGEWSRRVAP